MSTKRESLEQAEIIWLAQQALQSAPVNPTPEPSDENESNPTQTSREQSEIDSSPKVEPPKNPDKISKEQRPTDTTAVSVEGDVPPVASKSTPNDRISVQSDQRMPPLFNDLEMARTLRLIVQSSSLRNQRYLDIPETVHTSASIDDIFPIFAPEVRNDSTLIILQERTDSLSPFYQLQSSIKRVADTYGHFYRVLAPTLTQEDVTEAVKSIPNPRHSVVLVISDGLSPLIQQGQLIERLTPLPSECKIVWLHPWRVDARPPFVRRMAPGLPEPLPTQSQRDQITVQIVGLQNTEFQRMVQFVSNRSISWDDGKVLNAPIQRPQSNRRRWRSEPSEVISPSEDEQKLEAMQLRAQVEASTGPNTLQLLGVVACLPEGCIDTNMLVKLANDVFKKSDSSSYDQTDLAQLLSAGVLAKKEKLSTEEVLVVGFNDRILRQVFRASLAKSTVKAVIRELLNLAQNPDTQKHLEDMGLKVNLLLQLKEGQVQQDQLDASATSEVLKDYIELANLNEWYQGIAQLQQIQQKRSTATTSDDASVESTNPSNETPTPPKPKPDPPIETFADVCKKHGEHGQIFHRLCDLMPKGLPLELLESFYNKYDISKEPLEKLVDDLQSRRWLVTETRFVVDEDDLFFPLPFKRVTIDGRQTESDEVDWDSAPNWLQALHIERECYVVPFDVLSHEENLYCKSSHEPRTPITPKNGTPTKTPEEMEAWIAEFKRKNPPMSLSAEEKLLREHVGRFFTYCPYPSHYLPLLHSRSAHRIAKPKNYYATVDTVRGVLKSSNIESINRVIESIYLCEIQVSDPMRSKYPIKQDRGWLLEDYLLRPSYDDYSGDLDDNGDLIIRKPTPLKPRSDQPIECLCWLMVLGRQKLLGPECKNLLDSKTILGLIYQQNDEYQSISEVDEGFIPSYRVLEILGLDSILQNIYWLERSKWLKRLQDSLQNTVLLVDETKSISKEDEGISGIKLLYRCFSLIYSTNTETIRTESSNDFSISDYLALEPQIIEENQTLSVVFWTQVHIWSLSLVQYSTHGSESIHYSMQQFYRTQLRELIQTYCTGAAVPPVDLIQSIFSGRDAAFIFVEFLAHSAMLSKSSRGSKHTSNRAILSATPLIHLIRTIQEYDATRFTPDQWLDLYLEQNFDYISEGLSNACSSCGNETGLEPNSTIPCIDCQVNIWNVSRHFTNTPWSPFPTLYLPEESTEVFEHNRRTLILEVTRNLSNVLLPIYNSLSTTALTELGGALSDFTSAFYEFFDESKTLSDFEHATLRLFTEDEERSFAHHLRQFIDFIERHKDNLVSQVKIKTYDQQVLHIRDVLLSYTNLDIPSKICTEYIYRIYSHSSSWSYLELDDVLNLKLYLNLLENKTNDSLYAFFQNYPLRKEQTYWLAVTNSFDEDQILLLPLNLHLHTYTESSQDSIPVHLHHGYGQDLLSEIYIDFEYTHRWVEPFTDWVAFNMGHPSCDDLFEYQEWFDEWYEGKKIVTDLFFNKPWSSHFPYYNIELGWMYDSNTAFEFQLYLEGTLTHLETLIEQDISTLKMTPLMLMTLNHMVQVAISFESMYPTEHLSTIQESIKNSLQTFSQRLPKLHRGLQRLRNQLAHSNTFVPASNNIGIYLIGLNQLLEVLKYKDSNHQRLNWKQNLETLEDFQVLKTYAFLFAQEIKLRPEAAIEVITSTSIPAKVKIALVLLTEKFGSIWSWSTPLQDTRKMLVALVDAIREATQLPSYFKAEDIDCAYMSFDLLGRILLLGDPDFWLDHENFPVDDEYIIVDELYPVLSPRNPIIQQIISNASGLKLLSEPFEGFLQRIIPSIDNLTSDILEIQEQVDSLNKDSSLDSRVITDLEYQQQKMQQCFTDLQKLTKQSPYISGLTSITCVLSEPKSLDFLNTMVRTTIQHMFSIDALENSWTFDVHINMALEKEYRALTQNSVRQFSPVLQHPTCIDLREQIRSWIVDEKNLKKYESLIKLNPEVGKYSLNLEHSWSTRNWVPKELCYIREDQNHIPRLGINLQGIELIADWELRLEHFAIPTTVHLLQDTDNTEQEHTATLQISLTPEVRGLPNFKEVITRCLRERYLQLKSER